MSFARFIGAVQRLAGQAPAHDELLSPDRFHRVLDRERARADRTGDKLSLLAFAPRVARTDRATFCLVTKVLRGRMRVTDELGWLEDGRLAIVLPATPAAGAWKVADDVCLEFPEGTPPPICTVYTYPPDGPTNGETLTPPNGELAKAVNGKIIRWCAGVKANGHSPSPSSNGHGRSPPHRPSFGLDQFLVRPLPLWKRTLDVIGAAVLLVVLSPVFAAIAIGIKLSSRGPVCFRQRRSGRGGVPFLMYKFRTMVIDAEARKAALMELNQQDGPAFKVRSDPRVTTIGRLLRRTSLDELPQLWNVLLGQMSLVGPRPLPCDETRACALWHRQRLDVTPGLTCIWQVRGRSRVSFAEWVRMDVQYIRSRSLAHDLKLLALTVPAVVSGKGAH